MTDLSNKDPIKTDLKPVTGARRYLTWSFFGVLLCCAPPALVFLYVACGPRNTPNYGGEGLLILLIFSAIPVAIALVNLGFSAFLAVFVDETRLVGWLVLTAYLGAFSYYYYYEHRDERHAFLDLAEMHRLASNACSISRLVEKQG